MKALKEKFSLERFGCLFSQLHSWNKSKKAETSKTPKWQPCCPWPLLLLLPRTPLSRRCSFPWRWWVGVTIEGASKKSARERERDWASPKRWRTKKNVTTNLSRNRAPLPFCLPGCLSLTRSGYGPNSTSRWSGVKR